MNIAIHSFISSLKELSRKGWLRYDIDAESVADHSYGVAMLSMIMADELGLDAEKCMRMALLHDLPESIVGDTTPHDDVSRADKKGNEKKAARQIEDAGLDMQLWHEYEQQSTAEARLVRDMDRIEMALQAFYYEKEGKKLDEFFTSAEEQLQLDESKSLLEKIRAARTSDT